MAHNNLDAAFANISSLLDLASSMAIENPERAMIGDRDGYFSEKEESEQLVALLIVTRDYARRKLAGHDEGRAA